MHPHLSALVAAEHRHDLLRAAEHHRLVQAARGCGTAPVTWPLRYRLHLPLIGLLRPVRPPGRTSDHG
jgi:hypothetical protein